MTTVPSPRATAQHRLPTNTTTRHHPVHRWLNFIAGFSPEFVNAAIIQAALPAEAILLDPFTGMATALVESNLTGIDAIGYEPHPFFYDIALAKVSARNETDLDVIESILKSDDQPVDAHRLWGPDAHTFLSKLIDKGNLAALAQLRAAEDRCPAELRNLYRLVVTRILEGAAGAKTDGIYKAPTTLKRSVDIEHTTKAVLGQIRQDIGIIVGNEQLDLFPKPKHGTSVIYGHTAEAMPEIAESSIDICVTSPPYFNNFDFAEMTRMELYYWNYAASWREITDQVRSKLIINTTTAPTAERRRQDHWVASIPDEILATLMDLKTALTQQKLQRPGKKEYDSLVFPYFSQMNSVIKEVHRTLKAGASFHMVVSDAALYGVHVHTEDLLAHLMSLEGFEVKEIIRLRDRGGRWVLSKRQGSADGLGEFHIHAVKGV